MNFTTWLETVPLELKEDALWKMRVYQVALFVADIAWSDVSKLHADKRTIALSDQLYRSVGSVAANIAEGYSRSSGRDRVRFYEYALGSAREARSWYYTGRHLLGPEVVAHRLQLLSEVVRLLLTIIPAQRQVTLREASDELYITDTSLSSQIPGV